MKYYDIIIDQKVEKHIESIIKYVAYDLCNKQAALMLLNKIESSIDGLANFPNSHPLVDEEPWRSIRVRKVYAKSYIIYYRVYENEKRVHVTSIVYSKRDQFKQLSEIDTN